MELAPLLIGKAKTLGSVRGFRFWGWVLPDRYQGGGASELRPWVYKTRRPPGRFCPAFLFPPLMGQVVALEILMAVPKGREGRLKKPFIQFGLAGLLLAGGPDLGAAFRSAGDAFGAGSHCFNRT
jgi:hypothetical protein